MPQEINEAPARATTPDVVKPHGDKYEEGAWRQYSMRQLGNWVENFTIRAGHRTDRGKAQKDLDDARNYLAMLESHVEAQAEALDLE